LKKFSFINSKIKVSSPALDLSIFIFWQGNEQGDEI
jgi:hypothetical protein